MSDMDLLRASVAKVAIKPMALGRNGTVVEAESGKVIARFNLRNFTLTEAFAFAQLLICAPALLDATPPTGSE